MKGQKIIFPAIASVVLVSLIFVLNYSSIYADESIVDVQLTVPVTTGFLNPFDTQKGIGGFGENVEVIISSHTPGHKGPLKGVTVSGDNTIKCSIAKVFKCTVINSGAGLESIKLSRSPGLAQCDLKDTRDGAGRGSVDTRKTTGSCNYVAFNTYELDIDPVDGANKFFCVTHGATDMSITPGTC